MLITNIDGGGMRGYASLLILQTLMDSIREIEVANPEVDHSADTKRQEKPFSRENFSHGEPRKKTRKISEERMCIFINEKLRKETSPEEEDLCLGKAVKPSSLAFSDGDSFSNDTVDDTASSIDTSSSCTISRGMSSESSATEWSNRDDVTMPGVGVDNNSAFPEQKDDFIPSDYFETIVGTSTGGVIAIMLGRLRMSVNDCLRLYEGHLGDCMRVREDPFRWLDPLSFDPSRHRIYTPPECSNFMLNTLSSYPATTIAFRDTFSFIFEA